MKQPEPQPQAPVHSPQPQIHQHSPQPPTQSVHKPFMPMVIIPTSTTTTIVPQPSASPTSTTPYPNPYISSPYTPQAYPSDTQTIIHMKTLKYKFLRLVKLNPDILPSNYKYKYGLYSMFSGVSYVSFFLYMAYKTNFAMSADVDKKMLWKYAFRFIGGYFLITVFCNFMYETAIGPAFDQQFAGMSIPDIENELSKIKESTVILRY
jgi:hypothetical protein